MAPIFPMTPAGINSLLILCNDTHENEKMTTKMMTMMTPTQQPQTMTATMAVQQCVGNTTHHHHPSATHLDAQTILKPPVDTPEPQYEPPLSTNHHTQQTYTTQ